MYFEYFSFVTNLNSHMVHTYAQVKSVFKFETYLDTINDFKKGSANIDCQSKEKQALQLNVNKTISTK